MVTKFRAILRTGSSDRVKRASNLEPRVLVKIALMWVFVTPAFGQQTQILIDDSRALVTRIELAPAETFTLPNDQAGSVWITLDPIVLATKKDDLQSTSKMEAGKAGILSSGEQLVFKISTGSRARLVVVKPKTPHQDLTVDQFLQSGSLEDASDRNATLLIAISNSRFRDTRNLGDESEWKPGKPNTITMQSGTVRWIRSGIHHFKNLGPKPAKLVSIEW